MPSHVVLCGIGYGDEGKGSLVDALVREDQRLGCQDITVIRFNGGAQAAHNVVTTDGRHHTFAQFGAGTLAGARTFLSRFMLVDPLRMATEAVHLKDLGLADPWSLMTIDREALMITPYHREVNRARELSRGDGRHGSCGVGVGETMSYSLAHPFDAPMIGDCLRPARLKIVLERCREWANNEILGLHGDTSVLPDVLRLVETYLEWSKAVNIVDRDHLRLVLDHDDCIFEGAQGALLDEWHGFHPYTTWSTTTSANADELLAEAGHDTNHIGVLRAYMTRHGPGPFVTEDPNLNYPERHNATGEWQREFRLGHFDALAYRYALEINPKIEALAITHLDQVKHNQLQAATSYKTPDQVATRLAPSGSTPNDQWYHDLNYQEMLTTDCTKSEPIYDLYVDRFPEDIIEELLGKPVLMTSRGPKPEDKRFRLSKRYP